MLDHKVIINSDGADIEIYDSKPEFSVTAIARRQVRVRQPMRGLVSPRVERPFQKEEPSRIRIYGIG